MAVVDLRWQMVVDGMGADSLPSSQGAQRAFRERMVTHAMDRVLIERTVTLARAGALTEGEGRALSKALRVAIDGHPVAEAGELLALFRWVKGDEADAFARGAEHAAGVRDEVADVAIALLLLCDRVGIDLEQAVRDKLAINARNYPVEQARGRAERPR